ncbi:MAG: hypothetical protein M0Q02_04710, partial [Candidatus Muirbacterium halophilum]|nr:hypothetical protein [Candidatus Muirbacterium halophilum]
GLMYYKNDTHWNNLGGFIGFLKFYNTFFVRDFGYKTLNIDDFSIKQINVFRNGDLDSMLGQENEKETIDFDIKYSDNVFITKKIDGDKHFITRNTNGKKLKVLIYRDSFFCYIYELFSKTFFEVEYISSHIIDLDFIKKNNYDIVIVQCVERNVDSIELLK